MFDDYCTVSIPKALAMRGHTFSANGRCKHCNVEAGLTNVAPPRPDVALSTGRIIKHQRLSNGAQEAFLAEGGEMTSEEWAEYCDAVRRA